jgi:hypothetical protein
MRHDTVSHIRGLTLDWLMGYLNQGVYVRDAVLLASPLEFDGNYATFLDLGFLLNLDVAARDAAVVRAVGPAGYAIRCVPVQRGETRRIIVSTRPGVANLPRSATDLLALVRALVTLDDPAANTTVEALQTLLAMRRLAAPHARGQSTRIWTHPGSPGALAATRTTCVFHVCTPPPPLPIVSCSSRARTATGTTPRPCRRLAVGCTPTGPCWDGPAGCQKLVERSSMFVTERLGGAGLRSEPYGLPFAADSVECRQRAHWWRG